jgi:hypothetical protein
MANPVTPWQDRFRTPDTTALRKSVDPEAVDSYDRIRGHLLKIDGITEAPGWHGSTYCWCLEYRLPDRDEPMAILIPSPIDLQLAMPIDHEFLEQLPIRRMKRAIRDGLDLASPPFDTTWAIWSLVPGSFLEELEDVIDRRVRFLTEAAGN